MRFESFLFLNEIVTHYVPTASEGGGERRQDSVTVSTPSSRRGLGVSPLSWLSILVLYHSFWIDESPPVRCCGHALELCFHIGNLGFLPDPLDT